MVTLVYPNENENWYFNRGGFLFGPVGSDGKFWGNRIDLPVPTDSILESRGIYHENNVTHSKITGILTTIPAISEVIPSPEYGSQAVQANDILALYGLATDYAVTCENMFSYWRHQAVQSLAPGEWVVYVVSSIPYQNNGAWTCWQDTLKIIGVDSSNRFVVQVTRLLSDGRTSTPDIDWSQMQPFAVVSEMFFRQKSTFGASTSTFNEACPRTQLISSWTSPKRLKDLVYLYTGALSQWTLEPTDEDYGELALEASKKINANNVNMIAFLRDLRHPTELIPKLKNLNSIKGLADNYLTVKYGILPTVSDIKNIVEAFKKLGPYLDKNGFATYGSVRTNTLNGDDYYIVKEQRVKLAIDNDDEGLTALFNTLESWGGFPTFQNLWDLVPYSFVIDWLIDVGGLLERVDMRLRLLRLGIRYVTMSRKLTVVKTVQPSVTAPLSGALTLVRYHRWVSDQCPVPPLSLQEGSGISNHWLESGALLAQRSRRK